MANTVIRRELSRAEREQFYVMARAYFPDAVIIPETEYDSMMWLFGYDRKTNKNTGSHKGAAMIMGTSKGVYLYVIVKGNKSRRICKTKKPALFMSKLRKLSNLK
jgi:hypothetical protein